MTAKIEKEKVLSLSTYKAIKTVNKQEQEINDFYATLDFHSLFIEVNTTIIELQNRKVTSDLALKSRAICSEFQKRVASSSTPMTESLKTLSSQLSLNIDRLMAIQ